MQQYYIDEKLLESIKISSDLYHYLKNVVKIKSGEEFYLFNGHQKAIYTVETLNATNQEIIVNKKLDINIIKDKYKIDLMIGLLKKDNLELVIQKTTELGINNILLTKLNNNVVKFEQKKIIKKLARYNEIALSAVCQSKRSTMSNVEYIENISSVDFLSYDYVYFLYEKEDDNIMINSLNKISNIENKSILLICGPEGGFTKEEIEFFKTKGESVSINNNILRAETAAIVAVGLIKGIKG